MVQLEEKGMPVFTSVAYPPAWDTCPKAFLRADIRPEAHIAAVTTHAAAAEFWRHWPNVPNKLWELMHFFRRAENERDRAEQQARMERVR